MTHTRPIHPFLPLLALAAGLAFQPAVTLAQTGASPERFTAMAVNMSGVGPPGATSVEIVVKRWSTDAERDQLLSVLMDRGPGPALDVLRNAPEAGYIRPVGGLGYQLHFARRTPLPKGGERITLITDRPIQLWEAANQTRSTEYPFTVLELHVGKDGQGDGKLSIATRIMADKESGTIVLEDYAEQPITLTDVKQEKMSH
jgi:hypothetical protein